MNVARPGIEPATFWFAIRLAPHFTRWPGSGKFDILGISYTKCWIKVWKLAQIKKFVFLVPPPPLYPTFPWENTGRSITIARIKYHKCHWTYLLVSSTERRFMSKCILEYTTCISKWKQSPSLLNLIHWIMMCGTRGTRFTVILAPVLHVK